MKNPFMKSRDGAVAMALGESQRADSSARFDVRVGPKDATTPWQKDGTLGGPHSSTTAPQSVGSVLVHGLECQSQDRTRITVINASAPEPISVPP